MSGRADPVGFEKRTSTALDPQLLLTAGGSSQAHPPSPGRKSAVRRESVTGCWHWEVSRLSLVSALLASVRKPSPTPPAQITAGAECLPQKYKRTARITDTGEKTLHGTQTQRSKIRKKECRRNNNQEAKKPEKQEFLFREIKEGIACTEHGSLDRGFLILVKTEGEYR